MFKNRPWTRDKAKPGGLSVLIGRGEQWPHADVDPEEGIMEQTKENRYQPVDVFHDIIDEPADNWRPCLRDLYGKSANSMDNVSTIHLYFGKVGKFFAPPSSYLSLSPQRCLVEGPHRWVNPHILVFPRLFVQRQKIWGNYCAWLTTIDGRSIPIVPYVRKYGTGLRQKTILTNNFHELFDLPEVKKAHAEGLSLKESTREDGCMVVELRYGSRVIIDTTQESLGVMFNFMRDIPQIRMSFLMNKIIPSLEEKRHHAQGRFIYLKTRTEKFFTEAIARFDATKKVSHAKPFGEFRKFLELEQKWFQTDFSDHIQ